MIKYTRHAEVRCWQRKISRTDVDYVKQFGLRYPQEGMTHVCLHYKDLPQPDRDQKKALRLVGTNLVLTHDSTALITAYPNRKKGIREIHRGRNHLPGYHKFQPHWDLNEINSPTIPNNRLSILLKNYKRLLQVNCLKMGDFKTNYEFEGIDDLSSEYFIEGKELTN